MFPVDLADAKASRSEWAARVEAGETPTDNPFADRPVAPKSIITEAFALYDAPLWSMALIASRLHLVWVGAVCGKMPTDYRYSNTLGSITFPVPTLTDQNKADLTRCAEDILQEILDAGVSAAEGVR